MKFPAKHRGGYVYIASPVFLQHSLNYVVNGHRKDQMGKWERERENGVGVSVIWTCDLAWRLNVGRCWGIC